MPQPPPKRDALASEPFSYSATKNGVLHLYAQGKIVKSLKGKEATRLLHKLETADAAQVQLLLAKATGQFKFGNERRGS